ncbi:hypothetical protein GF339_23745, partial [candidate division KSB3 bacterium]|nr:hypothetical protein [candidate division KSB3 bacterium]
HAVLQAIVHHQPSRIFSLMNRIVARGDNLRLFCMELMERIRNLIVLKVTSQPDPYLNLFNYTRADLEPYLPQTTLSELQQIYWSLAQVEHDIKFSPNPRYILEMALVKLTQVQALEPLETLYARLQEIKTTIASQPPDDIVSPSRLEVREPQADVSDAPMPPQHLMHIWETILQTMKSKRPAFAATLKNMLPLRLTHDQLTVGFHQETEFAKASLEDPKNAAILAEVLHQELGRSVRIVTTTHNGATSIDTMRKKLEQQNATIPRPEGPPPERRPPTPSAPRSRGKSPRKKGLASQRRYKPPVQVSVQDIIRLFDGEIEES